MMIVGVRGDVGLIYLLRQGFDEAMRLKRWLDAVDELPFLCL